MEKHGKFMAELRVLLERYHALLVGAKGDIEEVYVVYMDDVIGTSGAYDGHPVYNDDGEITGCESSEEEE